ncbi:tripartite tricarboxylate transporter TctB family protein [Nocardia goodfellowii]|uniref:Tricarboxylic transport membrane protein n=1 Tax=Nocardia goodfellowii TaxID=882446 RepID=A0ABS4QEN8_9NOCA|nr:tripartite tricarboxylate transporter TctB family protein [Nocardia goodfellowii]MBP2189605.1 putative tricarboxylic transport membrane protein [Nocardia goodfellowii]
MSSIAPEPGDSETSAGPERGAPRTGVAGWFQDRSELVVSVLLAGAGAVVITDALRMSTSFTQRGPVGPKAMPLVVGALLVLVAAALAFDVLRGGRGEAEGGEDVDLSAPPEWRTVALLIGVFVANIVLIDIVGFPIAGTLLFWGAAFALGSRHWVRDPLIAVALALVTYVVFGELLGVTLPGGPLEGVLSWGTATGGVVEL